MPKVILTYGTFDLFHYGHLNLLRRASELGDSLVVGISSDTFNAIKGKKAHHSFQERAENVASLRFVDKVFVEHTWDQKHGDVIKHQAHALVMGDDWTGEFDDLPCKVIYLPRTPIISSTAIRKIHEGN